MKRIVSLQALLTLIISIANYSGHAQTCKSGILNPMVAGFLKEMPADNRSLEEMKNSTNFVEFRRIGPPSIPYPAKDVELIKLTSDSVPILIFNPTHGTGLPIIINYHGGGFIVPLTAGWEYMAWQDSQIFNAIVFAVDYRVAPENKFPAAVNDCYNTFKWISENAEKFGGDTSRIAIMGVSAGANLAAVVCQKAKQEGIVDRIKLQVMNCPSTDNPNHAQLYPSMQENATGYFLTKVSLLFAIETYSDKEEYDNPELAPILSKDLSGLPPAVLITTEFDPLRDQGAAYAERLRKAGVKVWQQCFAGEIHSLIATPVDGPHAKAYQQTILTAMGETMPSK